MKRPSLCALLAALCIGCCLSSLLLVRHAAAKSIIMANYHNVLLFFPREYGGNDDMRVIFDVRNVTIGTFQYMPSVVDVVYDSALNQAYCYMESAVTSYIMLLKWTGGRWCYQVLFDFPASAFSKYMYHSVVVVDNFLYWTTDRYVMSGRLPGYEKRPLLQPAWNRLYSMSEDRARRLLYVAAYDYVENALFRCSLRAFSCRKLLGSMPFTLNYAAFDQRRGHLYVASIEDKFLYRYHDKDEADDESESESERASDVVGGAVGGGGGGGSLVPVGHMQHEVANMLFVDDGFLFYTNQQTITIVSNADELGTTGNTTTLHVNANGSASSASTHRNARAKLIDPYALQYVFTFNQVVNFDSYPYPYQYADYHDLLYRNSLFLFYYYVCAMDVVDNEHAFLPQMDASSRLLRIDSCQTRYAQERDALLVPLALAVGSTALLLGVAACLVGMWRSRACEARAARLRRALQRRPSLSAAAATAATTTSGAKANLAFTTDDYTDCKKSSRCNSDGSSNSGDTSNSKSLPMLTALTASVERERNASTRLSKAKMSVYGATDAEQPPNVSASPTFFQQHQQQQQQQQVDNRSPSNSELYDNDPISLSELHYNNSKNSSTALARQRANSASTTAAAPPRTFSSGIYILRKQENSSAAPMTTTRYRPPLLPPVATARCDSAAAAAAAAVVELSSPPSTPTFSQTSSTNSGDNSMTPGADDNDDDDDDNDNDNNNVNNQHTGNNTLSSIVVYDAVPASGLVGGLFADEDDLTEAAIARQLSRQANRVTFNGVSMEHRYTRNDDGGSNNSASGSGSGSGSGSSSGSGDVDTIRPNKAASTPVLPQWIGAPAFSSSPSSSSPSTSVLSVVAATPSLRRSSYTSIVKAVAMANARAFGCSTVGDASGVTPLDSNGLAHI